MNDILEIIKELELKRDLLIIEKEKNNMEICKCEQLIRYYMNARRRLFSSINSNRDSLQECEIIIEIAELMPSFVSERIASRIKDKALERIDMLRDEMNVLESHNYDAKLQTYNVQKKKEELLAENKMIESEIDSIDDRITQYLIVESPIKTRVKKRGK